MLSLFPISIPGNWRFRRCNIPAPASYSIWILLRSCASIFSFECALFPPALRALRKDLPMVTFRPAQENDLIHASEVVYENDIRGEPSPPPFPGRSATLLHIFQTGSVYVAEEDGHILAFAGAITRGRVTFLTDLFVRPNLQSSRLGQTLLQHVLPIVPDGPRCTISST